MRACYEMRLLMAHKKTFATRVIRYGILLLLLIMALGSLLSGCAGRRVAVSGNGYLSPEAALRALASSDPGDRTITVTARIEIKRHSERHLLKAALMMKRPAHLRLESIPLFGPPDFFLSIEAGEIRVFLPGKGDFLCRPGHREESFPILPSGPAGGRDSLPPDGPLTGDRGDGFFIWRGEWEDGMYRVDQYRSGGKILSLWIDPTGDLLRRIRTFTEGGKYRIYRRICRACPLRERVSCRSG